jgi:teichuronic acid exporter
MTSSLKSKSIHGLFWSFLERIGQQGIQFVTSIILARVLLPEQFGLVSMLVIFMAITQVFITSGFDKALIQKKDATYIDECSVFYFNILLGFLAAGLMCLAAPWIADFYNQPLLRPLTRVLSLNPIIMSFGLIQRTLLSKHIDFKTQLKVQVIASFLSGMIGITMAFNGFGVWSLVAQILVSDFLQTALMWVFHSWRPAWAFSFASLRTMFSFGSKLLVSGLLGAIFDNIYSLVIGKTFSSGELGFYSRAERLQQLPATNIGMAVGRVTFPVFSSIQDDKARLKRGLRKAISMLAMTSFPIMIGLAVVARPLVLVLLTDKWLPCVPYLQLLCVIGAMQPLHAINLNVLRAQGRSDLFLRLEILKRILVVISVAITYRWGITAMIYGQIVVSCLAYYLNCYYTEKLVNYSMNEQIRDILPSLTLASAMGGGVYLLHYIPFPNQLALLAAQIMSGTVLYVFLCRFFKLPSFMEAMGMTKLISFQWPKKLAITQE